MTTEIKSNKILETIEKIINKNVGRSFVVCDLNDIVLKYKNWRAAMPRIKPFYAVKCNNYPSILQLLTNLGAGFDCASKFEIEAILNTKCTPENIIYANTIKDNDHIFYARSKGVYLTTFDSLSELEKCKNHYPEAKLVIRIKTYSNNQSNFDEKFGCDPYTEAPILLKAAKSLKLDVVGVAFHVGTICTNPHLYTNAIKLSKYVFNIGHQLGFNFNVLDIGGGFIDLTETTIFETGKIINQALDDYFPDDSIKIIAEPGRYFVRSCSVVATKIISTKPKRLHFDCKEYMYYVDNGLMGLFVSVFQGFPAPLPVAFKKAKGVQTYLSTVFGNTMANTDVINKNIMLPRLEIGDWLIYKNMGAYTQCLESEFHLFKKAPVYFINNQLINKNSEISS